MSKNIQKGSGVPAEDGGRTPTALASLGSAKKRERQPSGSSRAHAQALLKWAERAWHLPGCTFSKPLNGDPEYLNTKCSCGRKSAIDNMKRALAHNSRQR